MNQSAFASLRIWLSIWLPRSGTTLTCRGEVAHETLANKGITLTVPQLDADLPAQLEQPLLRKRSNETIM